MKLEEFPPSMRAVAAITCILLVLEVLVALPLLFGTNWKIDPGMATIVGAVLGLSIVAWQAKIGFNNLIGSQENQAN